jgi:hypothetical protein
MAQIFRINKNSTLPRLRMELVNDGRYQFLKSEMFNNAIQNAKVYFSMTDENGVLRISKSEASVYFTNNESCEDICVIEYAWLPRDTKVSGKFKGEFEIEFLDDIYQDGVNYPSGNLIMPIQEELLIYIQ